MLKYFLIYEEAVSHIWICNCSIMNFLIYEENLICLFYQCTRTCHTLLFNLAMQTALCRALIKDIDLLLHIEKLFHIIQMRVILFYCFNMYVCCISFLSFTFYDFCVVDTVLVLNSQNSACIFTPRKMIKRRLSMLSLDLVSPPAPS